MMEGYKKEIEIFLATMSIFKGTRVMNNNKLNEEQKSKYNIEDEMLSIFEKNFRKTGPLY